MEEEDRKDLYYYCFHEWGDDWFKKYGSSLSAAMDLIFDYVMQNSSYYLLCKEKYGIVRYEHLYPKDGIAPNRDIYHQARSCLSKGIAMAVYKYPEVWLEILDDYHPYYN